MAATNKCNITKYALDKWNSLRYGFTCEDNSRSIIENYILYLNCPTVTTIVCDADNCKNDPIIGNCSLSISDIEFTLIEDNPDIDIAFTANFSGGASPFTYLWEFNIDDFTSFNGVNQSELDLKLKPGRDLDFLNTRVKVTIVDSGGCSDNKQCYYMSGDMNCDNNFINCPNTNNLVVDATAP